MKYPNIVSAMIAAVLAFSGCVHDSNPDSSGRNNVNSGSGGDSNSDTGGGYADGGRCGDGTVQAYYEICDYSGTRPYGPFEWSCTEECQTEVGTFILRPDTVSATLLYDSGNSITRVVTDSEFIALAGVQSKDDGWEHAFTMTWDGTWNFLGVGPHLKNGYDRLKDLRLVDGMILAAGSTSGVLDGSIDTDNKYNDYDGILLSAPRDLSSWQSVVELSSPIYDSPINSVDFDSEGYVYVAGSTEGPIGSGSPSGSSPERSHAFIRKMTVDGSEVWTVYLDVTNPAEASVFGTSISDLRVIPGTDYGYAVGSFDGPLFDGDDALGGYDAVLMKFSLLDGSVVWTVHLGSDGKDVSDGLAVMPDGSAVVVGTSGDVPYYILAARVDAQGNVMWEHTWGESSATYEAYDVDVDEYGYVYVVGTTDDDFSMVEEGHSSTGLSDAYLWILDPDDGSHVWVDIFNYTKTKHECWANDVHYDRYAATVYVSGACQPDIHEDGRFGYIRAYRLFWGN